MNLLFFWLDIDTGHKPSPNHGIAWIAGYLKSLGHQVNCCALRKAEQIDICIQAIRDYEPNCIGFSFTTSQRRYLDYYAEGIRKYFNGLIICGGVHATLDPEDVLKCEAVDGACIGEGEFPLSILAEHIDKGTEYRDIPSFWWKSKSPAGCRIIKNEVSPFIEDLSSLPFPDYTLFDMNKIHQLLSGYSNVMISRGCPYSCSYCCNHAIKSVYSKKTHYFRILSPEKSVEFLMHHKLAFPETKGLIFEDDLLLWNKEWFAAFFKMYVERIGIPFMCNGRFEMVQDVKTAQILKNAGCRMINFGLESGDESYRKHYLKRNISDHQILNSAKVLTAVNVNYFTYNIFGFPMETKNMMDKTIAINKKIRPSSGQAFFFYPYPGTELYNLCKENGLLMPEKMKQVSGYKESPIIKLTNCKEKECVKSQENLQLYFMARRLSSLLGIEHQIFESIVHHLLLCWPSLFTRLLSKDNIVKRALRKLQYA